MCVRLCVDVLCRCVCARVCVDVCVHIVFLVYSIIIRFSFWLSSSVCIYLRVKVREGKRKSEGRPEVSMAFRSPDASAAVEGIKTSSPGICAQIDSSVWA